MHENNGHQKMLYKQTEASNNGSSSSRLNMFHTFAMLRRNIVHIHDSFTSHDLAGSRRSDFGADTLVIKVKDGNQAPALTATSI